MKIRRPQNRRIVWAILVGVLQSLCVAWPDTLREAESAQDLIQSMLSRYAAQFELTNSVRHDVLASYDLNQATDEIMNKITVGPEYAAYFEQRKKRLSPDELKTIDHDRLTQGRWMIEYALSKPEVKPEIKAWLNVSNGRVSSWDQALAACHQLEEYRPSDFIPAFMLARKLADVAAASPTPDQWRDFLEIVRRALPHASNPGDATDCVYLIFSAAGKPEKTGNDPQILDLVWKLIRDAQVPGIQTDPSNLQRLNLMRFTMAVKVKDYTASIEIGRLCGMRAFEPLHLALAGKLEEAYDAQVKLRQDPTLKEAERVALRKLEPLVLLFAHKFDEARNSIRELRQLPNLSPQDTKGINVFEDLLRKFEEAARTRNGKQP